MIPVCEPSLSFKEYWYVFKALRSNWLTCGGKYEDKLEVEMANYHNAKYGVALSSGTAALHMALLALGIGKGDEVIVPSLSFVAVASMVKSVGAIPVVVDVNRDDWLIDAKEVANAITKKTKAIIPVHLYGNICDMDVIKAISREFNLYIIEDACEAIGTPLRGDISCLSFQSTKTMTTCEGGMCLANNKEVADKIWFYKNHAMTAERKYYHTEVGYNARLSEVQAAIGVAQLERLDSLLEKKRQIYKWYEDIFFWDKDITFQWYHTVNQLWNPWVTPILVEPEFGISRDELMAKLKESEIETRIMFYPIHLMPPYIQKHDCPIATELSQKGMYLPSGVNLKKSQVEYICDVIKRCKC
jgi:perosamine synthetase